MGKHYETLVDVVDNFILNGEQMRTGENVKDYLSCLIKSSELLEIPFTSPEIMPALGMEDYEYDLFLRDFLKRSKQNNTCVLTPYETTAIEDRDSVVIIDKKGLDRYLLTSCSKQTVGVFGRSDEHIVLLCGDVTMMGVSPEGDFPMGANLLYELVMIGGKRLDVAPVPDAKVCAAVDIVNSAMAFVEQAAYFTYPGNAREKN